MCMGPVLCEFMEKSSLRHLSEYLGILVVMEKHIVSDFSLLFCDTTQIANLFENKVVDSAWTDAFMQYTPFILCSPLTNLSLINVMSWR